MPVYGPYDSSREATADARAWGAFDAHSHYRGATADECYTQLVTTLTAAGVELGAYDREVANWICGWEPEVVQVVIGWLTRASK